MIELHPTVLSRPSTVCVRCKGILQCFSEFGILLDDIHIFSDRCTHCNCNREQHIDVSYRLAYDLSKDVNKISSDNLNHNLNDLRDGIIKFGRFFVFSAHTVVHNDSIVSFLDQMIGEENQICKQSEREYLNQKLRKKLNKFKDEYDKRCKSTSTSNTVELTEIYKLIEKLSLMDTIREQMDTIKQYQQRYMREQETRVA